MNFQNVNTLNVRLNKISGNLLPMTADSGFPIFWQIHAVFVWLLLLTRVGAFIPGIMSVSKEKAVLSAMTSIVFTTEVIFLNVQIHRHGKLMRRFILELNDILNAENNIMQDIVTKNTKPIMFMLNLYWIVTLSSTFVWSIMPFALVFKKSSFYYEDYKMPVAFSKEPFSTTVFVLGSLVISSASTFMILKKAGVDIYMVHLMLLTTVQYQYITTKLATIFREGATQDERNNSAEEYRFRMNSWMEKKLKVLCRHHNAVVHLSFLLKKLLSLNLNLIYVTSVFRFCSSAVLLNSVLVVNFFEGFLIVVFVLGSVLQFYVLCSSVQKLLDASTEMTDMTFHENWYQFGPSIKRTFILIILSNNLKCTLTTCGNLNLSLPSFMKILNQAYSVALLFLKMK